ncbi:Pentatricopeptide repeat-containing protein At5g55740, chloroplastic, partial [Linum perenne]
ELQEVLGFELISRFKSRMGLRDEASKVFEQIANPNIISWTTLMFGYSRAGKYDVCLKIFKDM